MTYTLNDVISRLENLRGEKLTEEEQNSVQYWHTGQQLRFTMSTEGWKVAMDTVTGYVVRAVEDLVKIDPAQGNEVAAAHCVSFVANRLLSIMQDDLKKIANREQPTVVKEVIQSQSPLENPL